MSYLLPSSESRDDTLVLDGPHITPLPVLPSPRSESAESRERENRLRWKTASVLLILVITLGAALLLLQLNLFRQANICAADPTGVTLYTDTNYRGQCHTFRSGDYELTRFGLGQNVSSFKNPHDAYHIVLFDKQKNFFYAETSMPVLPAGWDKRADMIHIEKHRPTTCHPGTDGILAFINTDYSGGCLFITQNIPDLTPSNFDQDIVSIHIIPVDASGSNGFREVE